MSKPLAIDLFCGLFGWSDGLIAEGWEVIGFDIEDMHASLGIPRPAEKRLVIQDVLTLHGSQFKGAALIVASPPCQAYSYRAMPWKRAKALPPPCNALFEACFRIQREACEAAGRHIPLIVENVRGAQPWVGRARWNFGSFYLWGDVPALMPITFKGFKSSGLNRSDPTKRGCFRDVAGHQAMEGFKGIGPSGGVKVGEKSPHWTNPVEGTKNDNDWFGSGADCSLQRRHGSKSPARKAASAMIAKIPLPLSRHIAATFRL